MEHLFIVTYGRSGSTALQNVLNCLPGYCIRGENGGAVNYLVKSRTIVSASQANHSGDTTSPSDPWYGIEQVNLKSFEERIVSIVGSELIRAPADALVTGFKDIRYTHDHLDDKDFAEVMDFLLCGMNGRIIFNTRSAEEVARSGWWRNRPAEEVIHLIEKSNGRFKQYLNDRTFLIDHSQYNGNADGFLPLLNWLGTDVPIERLSTFANSRLNHMKSENEKPSFSRSVINRAVKFGKMLKF